jgi:ABC-type glycerol-3-phosphate transport system substrate-binding protein
MLERIATLITAGAAATALAVAAGAAPSSATTSATTTWTVKPGGSVSAEESWL